MTMGAGLYTINGYLAFGDNGGGSVSCNGSTVGMAGTSVTFIVSGATTPGSGTCKNMVMCFGAGFNYVSLVAPTTGTFANALFIGPLTGSNNTAGMLMSGGAGASMSGAIYLPSGTLTMSGGASINTNPTQTTVNGVTVNGCVQIVAQTVSMSGGTTAASTCLGTGSGIDLGFADPINGPDPMESMPGTHEFSAAGPNGPAARRRLRRFLSDRRAASIVEFALVTPILLPCSARR